MGRRPVYERERRFRVRRGALQWASGFAVCPPDEIADTVHRLRSEHREYWEAYRDLIAFLQEHYPVEWERVALCRSEHKTLQSETTGAWAVRLQPCREVPFCPACNFEMMKRRTRDAVRAFQRATPTGKEPRFLHAVFRAPYVSESVGWGNEARKTVDSMKKFRAAVWRVLEHFYGEGIGAALTYHDIGERAWAKPNPHVDLTINGWDLKDGAPSKISNPDLTDGTEEWKRALNQEAADLGWPVVEGTGRSKNLGNVWFVKIQEGVPSYRAVLDYQLREIVDLKKVGYHWGDRQVHWHNYREPLRPEVMSADEFKAGFEDYRRRFDPWGDTGRRVFDGRYGILSDSRLRKAEVAFGGVDDHHREECPCKRCMQWRVGYIPAEDAQVGAYRPVGFDD